VAGRPCRGGPERLAAVSATTRPPIACALAAGRRLLGPACYAWCDAGLLLALLFDPAGLQANGSPTRPWTSCPGPWNPSLLQRIVQYSAMQSSVDRSFRSPGAAAAAESTEAGLADGHTAVAMSLRLRVPGRTL
jgi:hypothetical protein